MVDVKLKGEDGQDEVQSRAFFVEGAAVMTYLLLVVVEVQ